MSDVLIHTQEADLTAVDGVLVRIYDDQDVFVTQGTTGEGANPAGDRLFDLATGTFTMRLSMSSSGYSMVSPQLFTVTGVPADDIFDVETNLFQLPAAINSNLCRCSGYFKDITGGALDSARLRFRNMGRPTLLGSDSVLGGYVDVTTDTNGYAQIDLIQGANYRVTIDSLPDLGNEVLVPSLTGANLPDVIFPVVTSVTFNPPTLTLAVDASGTSDTTINYRSGLTVKLSKFVVGEVPVSFTPDVVGLVTIAIEDDNLKITREAAGTVVITATRLYDDDSSNIQVFPAAAAVSNSLTVS